METWDRERMPAWWKSSPDGPRTLGRVFEAVYRVVREPGDSDERRLQKALVLVAGLLGAPITIASAFAGLAVSGWRPEVLILFLYAAAIVAFIGFFIATKRGLDVGFSLLMLGNLFVSFYGSVTYGGPAQSGVSGLWGIVPPVLMLLAYGRRRAIAWFALYLVLLVASTTVGTTGVSADPQIRARMLSTLLGVSVFVFVMFLYFTRERDRAQAEANAERSRSDALLLDVLPGDIVTRLKGGETVIADRFAEATVLFADIADFTPMSATMTPDDLVRLLDEVFRAFDRLAQRYGVEKIKTIGDCYMAAAGVPALRRDHAESIAALALEMQQLVTSTSFQGHRLSFRIGIHSGPLVAGVIGEQKFIYDLWGDTVNTASRMESHGVAGRIQLTEATRDLLGSGFSTSFRGEVDVKGKGPMRVFLLDGHRLGAGS